MFELGENNPKWKGGVAEYPNHAEFKRMRLLVLKKSKGRCELCGERANIVHHIDGSKDNHSLNNLIALCSSCHRAIHAEDNGTENWKRTSKYIRKYGMSLRQMSEKYGGSPAFYSILEKKGQLQSFLLSQ